MRAPRRTFLHFSIVLLAVPFGVQAQTREPLPLEQGLGRLDGIERARVLADLTDSLRSRAPRDAIVYGQEALDLFERFSDAGARVRTLNEMAWAHMELGAYDRAIEHAERGLALAEAGADLAGMSRALNNLGVIQRRLGAFARALAFFDRSYEINVRRGDERSAATSLNNMSVVYGFDLGDYDRALEQQLRALEIRERLEDEGGVAQSHNNLGVIYDNLRDPERALLHLNEALARWRELDRRQRIAATLTNLAWVYSDIDSDVLDLDRALEYETESLAIREVTGSGTSVSASLWSIGHIHTLAGRYVLAEDNLERAMALREAAGEQRSVSTTLLSLARLDRLRGRLGEAEGQALRSLSVAQSISARAQVRDAYEELASIKEAAGDLAGALAAHRSFKAAYDELFSEDRERRIEVLRSQREADQAERQIERLTAENAMQRMEARQLSTLWGALLLTGLIGLLLYRRSVVTAKLVTQLEVRRKLEQVVEERTAELRTANIRLEDLSLTDELTGLRNRRYLTQTLDADLATSLRAYRWAADNEEGHPKGADIVFFLLDLDHFKSVNDRYGHPTGDRVLIQVAEVLASTCRASDTLLRWGGEEFLIVSRQVNRETAAGFAERLRRSLAEKVFDTENGNDIIGTCSIGFASFPFILDETSALDWEKIVELADSGLYEAKRRGRNAWVGVSATDQSRAEALTGGADALPEHVAQGFLAMESSFGG